MQQESCWKRPGISYVRTYQRVKHWSAVIRVEHGSENGWLSDIVMGFKNYWIWQLVFDGVGLYEANDSGSKHQSSVYVIQVILAKETIWLKPMLPNY